jgi:hypothetical protein
MFRVKASLRLAKMWQSNSINSGGLLSGNVLMYQLLTPLH